jgi:hypothetical protein
MSNIKKKIGIHFQIDYVLLIDDSDRECLS